MAESKLQAEVLLALGARPDVRLFRNHVGAGWMGQVVRKEGAHVLLHKAHYAAFGLAVGSGDLIGLQALTIGVQHVGMRIAAFLSAEIKDGKRGVVGDDQTRWGALMARLGARHCVIRERADMDALLLES